MKLRKSASKKTQKYFRVMVEDIVIRVVDVQARSPKHAIKQAKRMYPSTLHEVSRVSKISGTRDLTADAEVDFLDEPLFLSTFQDAEC